MAVTFQFSDSSEMQANGFDRGQFKNTKNNKRFAKSKTRSRAFQDRFSQKFIFRMLQFAEGHRNFVFTKFPVPFNSGLYDLYSNSETCEYVTDEIDDAREFADFDGESVHVVTFRIKDGMSKDEPEDFEVRFGSENAEFDFPVFYEFKDGYHYVYFKYPVHRIR